MEIKTSGKLVFRPLNIFKIRRLDTKICENTMPKDKVLTYIPARIGSKRIPNKNIRKFLNQPLIAYAIKQAKDCLISDRIIVDTDSKKIASLAKKYGAEVPSLRPKRLAGDKSLVVDSLVYLLNKLKKEENYQPSHVMILQTTSPLREIKDIASCWKMIKETAATTVLTVSPTHPKFYHLSKDNDTILVNGSEAKSNNTQAWPPAYLLNGCFVYIIKTSALLREKRIITKKTKAVVCPRWRSIDLDNIEDWVVAELIYKNKKQIERKLINYAAK